MAQPKRRRVVKSALSARTNTGQAEAAPTPAASPASTTKSAARQKQLERIALGATVVFVVFVGLLGWYSDGKVFTVPWAVLMSLESPKAPRDPAQNCPNPENAKTPYCIERKARLEADWKAISRHQRGKSNPFTLTEH